MPIQYVNLQNGYHVPQKNSISIHTGKKRKEMWTMLTVAGVRLQGWSWEDRGSSDRDMSIVIQNGQPEGNGGADNEKTGPIGLCCSWYS